MVISPGVPCHISCQLAVAHCVHMTVLALTICQRWPEPIDALVIVLHTHISADMNSPLRVNKRRKSKCHPSLSVVKHLFEFFIILCIYTYIYISIYIYHVFSCLRGNHTLLLPPTSLCLINYVCPGWSCIWYATSVCACIIGPTGTLGNTRHVYS